MRHYWKIITFIIILVLAGCASIPEDAKIELNKPVDCSTAKEDISILESEKASGAKQLGSGIKMIVPSAAVIGILRGDYIDREKVATGQYNNDIDAKIQEIKSTCGIE